MWLYFSSKVVESLHLTTCHTCISVLPFERQSFQFFFRSISSRISSTSFIISVVFLDSSVNLHSFFRIYYDIILKILTYTQKTESINLVILLVCWYRVQDRGFVTIWKFMCKKMCTITIIVLSIYTAIHKIRSRT